MEFVPVKIRVSEQEVSSTKGTLRDMLIDRGYTPIDAQLPGANRQLGERKIYALDEVRRAPCAHARPRSDIGICGAARASSRHDSPTRPSAPHSNHAEMPLRHPLAST
jgi:hypothetical protein